MNRMNFKRHNCRTKDITQFFMRVFVIIVSIGVLIVMYRKKDEVEQVETDLPTVHIERATEVEPVQGLGIVLFANGQRVDVSLENNVVTVSKLTPFKNMTLSYNAEDDFVVKQDIDEDYLIFERAVETTTIVIRLNDETGNQTHIKKVGVKFEKKD